MKEIKLTQGQVALVDDADYEWLNQYKWHAQWAEGTKSYYAVRSTSRLERTRQQISMHRQILGLEYGDPRTGDHIEPAETLNNQRSNLRIANTSEQGANKRRYANNTTGFKGVSKNGSGYQASIRLSGKLKYLGTCTTREEAHGLYIAAAKELHGDFARAA
jgi:hypothetical protein